MTEMADMENVGMGFIKDLGERRVNGFIEVFISKTPPGFGIVDPKNGHILSELFFHGVSGSERVFNPAKQVTGKEPALHI